MWLFPAAPAPRIVEAVVRAEQLGLDEIWIADEGVSREPLPLLAAAAVRTSRIRLAIGITSPLLRHPGALAASIATLDELAPGRAVLGLGVGGHLSLAPFGIATDRPVGVVRDAIATARAVLARASGFGYEVPEHAMPARDVPIWVGARGPQLVRLAAQHADGLFVSGCSPDELDRIAATVADEHGALAVYQSASDHPGRPSEHTWADIGAVLDGAIDLHRPVAVGINLVDSAAGADPVALVERGAEALLGD